MRNETGSTMAGQRYDAAYAVHHGTKDLREALGLYSGILKAHPESQEARYSRSQIHEIIKKVVPEPELFEALVEIGRAHIDQNLEQESQTPEASATGATP